MAARKPSELDSAGIQPAGAGSIPVIRSTMKQNDPFRPKRPDDPWESSTYNNLRRLFSRSQLRDTLTHPGNSRLVFAGQSVFKGQVAQLLYTYFCGNGTQLQHILGNLFRNERLERLFDQWQLRALVRAEDGFDINTHKHIFVFAVFGHVSQLADEDQRNWFIFKYILNQESGYLFSHQPRNRNLLSQADQLARQIDGWRIHLEMALTEDGLHLASAVLSDGTLLCEATSKSWRYARTKAVKQALNLLAAPGRKALLSDPAYQERVRQQLEAEHQQRLAELEARLAAKEAVRQKKEAERARAAKLRDAKRRQLQAAAKQRRAEHTARTAAKAAKEASPMSANKRRHLEDKKK